MAAGRVAPAFVAAMGLAAMLAAAPAFAQGTLAQVDTSPGPYYRGGTFRYRIEWAGGPEMSRMRLALGYALSFVELQDDAGHVVYGASEMAAAGCTSAGTPPRIFCPVTTSLPGMPQTVAILTRGPADDQLLTINGPIDYTLDWPTFVVVVRMRDEAFSAAACTASTAEWIDTNPGSTLVGSDTDSDILAACTAAIELDAITTDSPIELQRASPALPPTTIAIEGLIGANPVTVSEASYVCTPDGGNPGGCTDTAFAEWIVFDGTSTFPAAPTVQPVNHADPPIGTWVGHVGIMVGAVTGVAEVHVVEQPVPNYGLNGPVAVVADGAAHTIAIVEALNSNLGEEPKLAYWTVEAESSGDPQLLEELRTFLQGPAALPDPPSQTATFQVPDGFVSPTGTTPVDVTILASRDIPGLGTSQGRLTFTLTGDPAPAYCRIVDAATQAVPQGLQQIGVGTRVGFELQVSNDNVDFVATGADDWVLTPGDGNLETSSDGTQAVYVAPQGPTRETITAVTSLCSDDPTVDVEVGAAIGVQLTSDRSALQPGDVTRLHGEIRNLLGEAQNGVRVRLRLDAALAALSEAPRPVSAFEPRPTSIGDASGTNALPAAARALEFELDLPAGEQRFFLPVMARTMLPGRAQAQIEVFYPASVGATAAPAATDSVVIEISEDPELTWATLIGKVFHDKNGDGVQQPGEEGLPKAMVALSSGVYALTGEDGKYHIARLPPGRHAVKVNPVTLPLGAALTNDARREVTLTPGVFTKVSFGVSLPEIQSGRPLAFVANGSSAVMVDNEPVYRARLELDPGHTLAAFHGEAQVEAAVDEKGGAVLDLPLDAQEPHWILVERATDGRTWISSLAVHVYPRKEGGSLIVPWGPRPIAALLLPAPDKQVRASRLVIAGQAQAPQTLTVGGGGAAPWVAKVEKAEQVGGAIRCDLALHEPLSAIELTLDPAPDSIGDDPPAQRIRLPVQVDPTVHFLVALAGVEASAVTPRESGEGATWWDAGGAFFYRGTIKGKVLITAGADARARDVLVNANGEFRPAGRIGARLLAHDVRRIFRDLDPEAYYPVYGDTSGTVDERESGGRFFVRIEADQSYLKWGGINTAIADAEVGRYVRSLYGLGGRLSLGESDGMRLRATAFAAQPDTLAARDELVVTGGTLYYLGHKELVEGSLRVTLELLDEISGLPVRATPLVEGADYEADYAGGRIILDAALPYRTFGASITADAAAGRRARLLVEYEYLPFGDPTHDWSVGARLVGGIGPVSVGLTGVTELLGLEQGVAKLASRYTLFGAGVRLDLGEPLRLRVDFAHSDGGSHETGRSADGGLTFGPRSVADGRSGSAAAVELSTGLLGAEAAVYGRFTEAGFSDSRTAAGRALLQGGLRVAADLPTRTRVWGDYDYRETDPDQGPSATRQIGLLGAGQSFGDFSFNLEGRHEATDLGHRRRTLAGAEIAYRLTPAWRVSLRRRQLVSADATTEDASPSGETAAGVLLERGQGWQLGGEVGMSDDAEAFGRVQGSVPLTEETEIYAGYAVWSHLGAGLDPTAQERGKDGVVVGGRRLLDDGTLLYSEQSLRVDGDDRVLTRTVGGQLRLTKQTALSVAYERGSVSSDDVTDRSVSRDAAAVTGTLAGEKLSARLVVDGRVDRRPGSRDASLGAQGRVELRATEALTLALAGRGAHSLFGQSAKEMKTGRVSWEGALGAAWRPVETDWLNAFGRYAVVHERDREPAEGATAAAWLNQTSHVVAIAVVFDVVGPVAVSPKVAYRHTRARVAGDEASDRGLVTALRGDLHLSNAWDASLEGRACAAPGTDLDAKFGALAELSMLVMEWLRVGAGYNLSSITSQSVRCEEPGARGLFLRAEAVY